MEISKRKKPTDILKKYLVITLGSIIYAVGIALFLDPNGLAPGGVSGIAIILSTVIEKVPTGTWILIFNIPIMLLGCYKLGFRFLISTIYSLVFSSVLINIIIANFPPLTENPLLACAAGGVLASAGLGMVFRAGATTGGTDVIVKLLRLKFRHIPTGTIFLATDGLVVLASGIVFKDVDIALYAGIAVVIQTVVLNSVLYGSDEARMVYIISDNDKVIAKRLMTELDAGATFFNAVGAYTGNKKNVLMCALRMRSLPQAREIVREEDKDAFMIVTKATSIFGEGFKDHNSEDL